MLKVNVIKKPKREVVDEPGISLSVRRVLTGECVAADIRKVVDGIPGHHPYLTYLHTKGFSDSELLERKTEVIGALSAIIRVAFGTIKSNIVKVAGSSAGFPKALVWIGYGSTWGGLAIMLGLDFVVKKALDKAMKSRSVDVEGVSDVAGLEARRSAIPADASMPIKDAVWRGNGSSLDPQDIVDHLYRINKFFIKLNGMANTVQGVIDGKVTLEAWLSPFKGSGGNDVWSVPSLHHSKGFIIYVNNGSYFFELVTGEDTFPTKGTIPTLNDLKQIQRNAKDIANEVKKAEKHIRGVLGNIIAKQGGKLELKPESTKVDRDATTEAMASDEKAVKKPEKDTSGKVEEKDANSETKSSNKDGAFAFNALRVFFEEGTPLAKAAVEDAGTYVADSMGAILTYREPKETSKKGTGKATPKKGNNQSAITELKGDT